MERCITHNLDNMFLFMYFIWTSEIIFSNISLFFSNRPSWPHIIFIVGWRRSNPGAQNKGKLGSRTMEISCYFAPHMSKFGLFPHFHPTLPTSPYPTPPLPLPLQPCSLKVNTLLLPPSQIVRPGPHLPYFPEHENALP